MAITNSRRGALKKIAGSTALATIGASLFNPIEAAGKALDPGFKGRINHSVMWPEISAPSFPYIRLSA